METKTIVLTTDELEYLTSMLNISESVMVSFWRRTEDVYVVNASHYCTRDQALQLYNWLKQDQRITIYDFYKQE